MNVFSKIVQAEHSTIGWIEKEIAVIEGKAPTIERIVDAGLEYIGPALQIGLGALGQTAAATEVGVIVAAAQIKLKAASALVTDFGPTPTAASAFATIKTDLASILALANVKNPQTVATVTKAVAEVGTLATAVQTAADKITAAASNQPALASTAG